MPLMRSKQRGWGESRFGRSGLIPVETLIGRKTNAQSRGGYFDDRQVRSELGIIDVVAGRADARALSRRCAFGAVFAGRMGPLQ